MKYRKTKIALLVFLLLVLAAMLVPWKSLAEKRLTQMLEARGFSNVQLTVTALGLKQMELENISIGAEDQAITLDSLSLDYSLQDLWQGNFSKLELAGFRLSFEKGEKGWALNGYNAPASNGAGIPVTNAQINAIPFDQIGLDESGVQFLAEGWQADMPLQLEWNKVPPRLSLTSPGINGESNSVEITTGPLAASLEFLDDSKGWEGEWNISAISIAGALPLPPLEAAGKISAKQEGVVADGRIRDESGQYRASFGFDYGIAQSAPAILSLEDVSMPWNGGTLSVKRATIPLSAASYKFTLDVNRVSLNQLLESTTGSRVVATGTLSGSIPITIRPDGGFTISAGSLKADEPGTLQMDPSTIPGDQAQIGLVRDVMQNLHYSEINLGVTSGKDGKIAAQIVIQGNNPDIYNGRPVKLNLNLTGDVLNLIRQSIIPFNDPQNFLKGLQDEKN